MHLGVIVKFISLDAIRSDDPESWSGKWLLTLDLDWAPEFVLEDTLELLSVEKVPYTLFVTHDSRVAKNLDANSLATLGVHPNFNPLMYGDFRFGKSTLEVLDYFMSFVPDCTAVRNHCLTNSTLLRDELSERGFRYDLNTFLPHDRFQFLAPYKHWSSEMLCIPFCWEDDLHCHYGWSYNTKLFTDRAGLSVFNFHPIHIYLNTEAIDRYVNAKQYIRNESALNSYVNRETYGTRSFFLDLLRSGKE
jgi:hypothetical protein